MLDAEPAKAPQPRTEVIVQPAPKDPHAPLAVRPKMAGRMISCSTTKLYDLINSGERETFKLGKGR